MGHDSACPSALVVIPRCVDAARPHNRSKVTQIMLEVVEINAAQQEALSKSALERAPLHSETRQYPGYENKSALRDFHSPCPFQRTLRTFASDLDEALGRILMPSRRMVFTHQSLVLRRVGPVRPGQRARTCPCFITDQFRKTGSAGQSEWKLPRSSARRH